MRHVVVVGAGPSGLAVSLGLSHKLKCTVDLLEKHATFNVQGSTLGLAPNGVKALQEILCHDVKTLVNQGLPIAGSENVMLAWWIIRDWLLEKVRNDPNIKLHMNSKLVSIDDDESDHVTVHCQENTFRGDLVVGADGVHSQVRSLLGVAPNKKTGYRIWRGGACAQGDPLLELLVTQGAAPLGMLCWGRSSFAIFNHHPQLPMQLNWVFCSDDPTIEPDGTSKPFDVAEPYMEDDEIKPIVKRLFEKSASHELVKSYEMATTVLPETTTTNSGGGWGGRGRVTLIGDAAHAIRPTSGLGTALAFEDCAVLCRKLNNVENEKPLGREEMEKIILDFENERLERVRKISDEQHEGAEATHRGEKRKPWSEEYREWIYSGI